MNDQQKSELRSKVIALPEGWWKEEVVCWKFAELFSRYLVALHLVVRMQGEIHHDLSTGFILYHRERVMWATAGHVIDHLQKVLASPDIKILRAAWIDGCDISGAEAVPAVGLAGAELFSATAVGIDFGVAPLGRVIMMLQGNRDLLIMTEQAWRGYEQAEPE